MIAILWVISFGMIANLIVGIAIGVAFPVLILAALSVAYATGSAIFWSLPSRSGRW